MATPGSADRIKEFRFRHLAKPEEFRQLAEVERAVWGSDDDPPMSPAVQRAIQDNGGLVLGAFADIYLAGFSVGFLGWDGKVLYHYSHLTAVRPEYQNHHLGFRLKAYQRDEVLRLGLPEIRWTFDPLQSKQAMLTVRRLGAAPDRYFVHYFGRRSSPGDQGIETDRVRVRWVLDSERVVERLAGRHPSAEDDQRRWEESATLIATEPGDSGIRVPTEVSEPSGASATLEVPFDLGLVRAHEAEALRRWRHASRDAFRAALDLGWRVDDFAVVRREHERRSVYFLSPAPSAEESAGSPVAGKAQ